MNASVLCVRRSVIEATLASLQAGGRRRRESVALWLGRRAGGAIDIVESYVPVHRAAEDYFEIPRESIAALFQRIRTTGTMVAAQVHSHPHEAFHSAADDRWAIVRHIGAVSIVLPDFGLKTNVERFIEHAAIFVLTEKNMWQPVLAKQHVVEVHP